MFLLPSPRRQFLYFMICGFLLLISVSAGAVMVLAATIPRWPEVEARVLSSTVRTASLSGEGDVYLPQIVYAYQIAGKDYASGYVRIGDKSFQSKSQAQRYCDARLPGSTLTARYFPPWPQLAVLETGASNGPWMMMLVSGLAFIGFRVVAGFQGVRR